MTSNPRQLAFLALRAVDQGAFTDVALDRVLRQETLSNPDRRLLTELVYGTVRRQRSLDALIDQLAKKKAAQQPPNLRLVLHLGLYQLRYLNHIPASAAVNTSVELARNNGLKGLTGVVNGLLRQYVRLAAASSEAEHDPLQLPDDPVERLGIQYSFPDWIVRVWLEELGYEETAQLCQWLNQTPSIDLRINPLQTSIEQVEAAMQSVGLAVERIPYLPQALRLKGNPGSIRQLPGFEAGEWTVQDSSAQLVGHLLAPQAGETVIDACAAPGGKTTHIAELMGDRGTILAYDRAASRLKRLQENSARLGLTSIQVCTADSRELTQFTQRADRVLIDAPCSGLGTLHRHADARWRQTPDTVQELATLQTELLRRAATWVKPNGVLVYATCTLHPLENEQVIRQFLSHHSEWQISLPSPDLMLTSLTAPEGWIKVWPHHQAMDGFFMVRLQRAA